MAKRRLPSHRNDRLDQSVPYQELLDKRKTGRTEIQTAPPMDDDTPAETCLFDYSHLRCSLPLNLDGSGIFAKLTNGAYPDSYYLMRRTLDGYISATGMYKAAFPWSSPEEERDERKYHRTLQPENIIDGEIAGNVWIAPEAALTLATDYNLVPWIAALIDPSPIKQGASKDNRDRKTLNATAATNNIQSPPDFTMPRGYLQVPELSASASSSTRSRSKRSSSPTKESVAARKIASPRKKRAASSVKTDEESPAPLTKTKPVKVAKELAKKILPGSDDNATEDEAEAKAEEEEEVDEEERAEEKQNRVDKKKAAHADEVVHIHVKETVEKKNDVETTRTTVSVDLPASSPQLPLPREPEALIETAKDIVTEAKKAMPPPTEKKGRKRKASEATAEEAKAGHEADSESALLQQQRAAKKIKTGLETQLMKERSMNSGLLGISALLAVGVVLPYFM